MLISLILQPIKVRKRWINGLNTLSAWLMVILLEKLYDGHIANGSIFCTDSHKSYMQFTNDLSLEHKRIKRGKHKEGLYHIQHINALHSNLKK